MITVLLFAGLQEQAGSAKVELDFESLTVGELKTRMSERFPGLRLDRVMVAVNEEIVPSTAQIRAGDTVAMLPPVSGG